jgi:DNA-binding transcriptional MerR regulator
VAQIRGLLEAGLSTGGIRLLLPCAAGTAPDLDPCPELVATLRARLHRLDARIDVLARVPPSPQPLRRARRADASPSPGAVSPGRGT